MLQLTASMVGMLGGPALQVLVVLTIEREWRSLGFIQDMANLSEKTVHQAVRKLRTLGFINEQTRDREKYYRLVDGAVQLPFGASLDEPAHPEAIEAEAADEDEDDSRKIYGRRLNESMNQSDIDINQEIDSFIDDIAGNSGDEPDDPITPEELKKFGFYGAGLSQLAAIDGLSIAEVEYQVQNAPSLGAALARLKKRQSWPGPRKRDAGEGADRSAYVGGRFAAFINS